MLSDKQSLYLCSIITAGFLVAGILDILDSFIVLGFLCLMFLAVIINIFIVNPFQDEEDAVNNETTDTSEEG